MKSKKIIGIAAAALAAWLFALRGAGALVVYMRSWAFDHIDMARNSSFLQVNFDIKNPLFIGLTVTGVVGNVYVNGLLAGRVNNGGTFYLAPNSTSVMPVAVEIDHAKVTDAILYGLQNGIGDVQIAFDGNVLVGKAHVAVPVQMSV